MKNLIEELHKLDEYPYSVSEDFSKKVMKQIRNNKRNHKFNYVISLASIGIVACLAVFVVRNTKLDVSLRDRIENASGTNQQVEQSSEKENLEEVFNDAHGFGPTVANYKDENRVNNILAEGLKKETVEDNSEAMMQTDCAKSIQDEIQEILLNAHFNVEKTEDGLKVKASKEQVMELLKDYKNLIIEVQNEYVMIKES